MPATIDYDNSSILDIDPERAKSKTRVCFNCESGELLLGDYARYCFDCDTYLPFGLVDRLVDKFFYELVLGDESRAEELKAQLDDYERQIIESIKDAGNH